MTTLDRLRAALADRYHPDRELGAGGMATVYLAHDLKHDRDVAIKVLHPDLGAALGGERFLSEIRTTARLQHPHILPLLDSGDADGLLYYVMPLVTGETLRARLERERQLPVAEAVRIAREVASALDYAHRQNVIHRDIKPENILLHEGSALVADFGIALAVQTAGGQRMTQTGLSLGTPQYMSPEQAMGERTIDARSDIYALGAVTYEMLTGEPPFSGATVQAIVSKVLTEKPPHPTAVRDTIPRHVEATVLMALAKVPADRFATAAEFAHALVHAEATAAMTVSPPGANVAAGRARGPFGSASIAWAVAGLAMIVAGWASMTRREPAEPTEAPLLSEAPGVELHPTAIAMGARALDLSSDGRHLAWLGADSASGVMQVFVTALGGDGARAIPGTEGAGFLWLSPDARLVAFGRMGELLVVGVAGGAPRTLLPSTGITSLMWSSDEWLFFTREQSVWRVRATGGAGPELVLRGVADTVYAGAHAIEESGTLVLVRSAGGTSELVATSLDGGPVTPLGLQAIRAYYARGVLVFAGPDGMLQSVGFDPRRRRTLGEPRPVGDSPLATSPSRFALARTGLLVFSPQDPSRADLVLVDRAGRARVVGDRRGYLFPKISPNGTRAVVGIRAPTASTRDSDLWSIDLTTGVKLRLTTDAVSSRPAWAPDGRSVLFSRRGASGLQELARVNADGTTAPTTLLAGPAGIFEAGLTEDGRTLVWRQDSRGTGTGTGTGRDILAAPVDTPSAPRPILQTRFSERGIAIGPKGDWLAYVSDESGRDEVYIRRLAPGSPRWPVSRNGGVEPRWTRSGEVFFRKVDSVFVSRVTLGGAEPRISEPTLLFTGQYQSLGFEATWDAAPDGKSFLMVRESRATRSRPMLYSNWIGRQPR